MASRAFRLAVLLGLSAVAVPCLAAEPAMDKATMAVPNYSLSFALAYVAEDEGFWKQQGLEVKSLPIAGLGSINAVIAGSVDFAISSASSLTRAATHGQRLLAIANMLGRPVVEIVLRKEIAQAAGFDPKAPLAKRMQVLRGHTLAVDGVNTIINAYLRLLASRAGYNPDEIRLAVLAPENAVAAYETKAVDGMAMSLPWPLKPVEEGTAVTIASGPDGDPPDMQVFGHVVLVTRPDTCTTRKVLCEKIGHGLAQAAVFIKDHPAESLALVQKRFPSLDGKLVAAAFTQIRKSIRQPPAMQRADLENAEKMNIGGGLMKPDEKLKSYDGLFTDAFVR